MVLDVDAGADGAAEVVQEHGHGVLARHGGQDQRGQEGEVSQGSRAKEEGLVTLRMIVMMVMIMIVMITLVCAHMWVRSRTRLKAFSVTPST